MPNSLSSSGVIVGYAEGNRDTSSISYYRIS